MGRVVCPVFVGRGAELDQLAAVVERAGAGHPSVVLVTGEAGVGKSRLVDELAARTRSTGASVAVGGCIDCRGVGLPYAPLAEAFRDLAAQLGSDWADVTGDLPQDLAWLTGRDVSAGGLGDPRSTPTQGQLFEMVLRLLVRVGEKATLLIVLEDLHWADSSTLDLVAFLARNLRRCRVAVVATYRGDDLRRGHRLRPWLAELTRARLDCVELGRFNRAEVRLLLEGILGAPPAGSLVDTMVSRAQGNAFCTEELIAAAHPDDAGLPQSLRDVLSARVEALPQTCRAVLQMMATAGPRIRHGLLERVIEPMDADLDDVLGIALEAGVLVAVPPDSYHFHHVLMQEALAGEVMPGRRRRLHRAVAEALEERPDLVVGGRRNAVSELAYHWDGAGEPELSLAASVVAGRAADALAAPAEASAHYSRALSLWDVVDDAHSLTGLDHADVLIAAAVAANMTGDVRQAMTLASRAMTEIDVDGDRIRRALIRERLGRLTWLSGDGERALDLYEQAAALVRPEPPSPAKAKVLAAHAQGLMMLDRQAEAMKCCEEAITVARQVADEAAEGQATNTLGCVLAHSGRLREGVDHLHRALQIAEVLGDPDDLLRALHNLCWPLEELGRPADVIELARRGIDIAVRTGRWASKGRDFQIDLVDALIRDGRVTEAAAVFAEIDPGDDGAAALWLFEAAAELGLAAGDVSAADAAVDAALARTLGACSIDDIWIAVIAAQVRLAAGRIEEAREHIDDARKRLAEGTAVTFRIEAAAVGVMVEGEAARRGARRPHVFVGDRASRLLREAQEMADGMLCSGGKMPPSTAAFLALARAEATVATGKSDPCLWAEAVAALDDASLFILATRARLRRAEAILASHGSRGEAGELVAQARAKAESAGAVGLVAEADQLIIRARLDNRPVQISPLPVVDERSSFGLTPRETEVLGHLARGCTNHQIADALFISEKTASVHVSNLLRKLGVTNRVDAGAVGQYRGLS